MHLGVHYTYTVAPPSMVMEHTMCSLSNNQQEVLV